MTGKTTRHTTEEIAAAITKSHGILSDAARTLHCSRQTIYNHLEKSKQLQDIYDNASETLLDLAESKLLDNIQNGNVKCIIFYLRTKGKHRGYTSKKIHNIDCSKLTNDELDRVIKGEDPLEAILACRNPGR